MSCLQWFRYCLPCIKSTHGYNGLNDESDSDRNLHRYRTSSQNEEANKDQANKCIEVAKRAIAQGEMERAVKFFTKAQRLNPSISISEYLKQINESIPFTRNKHFGNHASNAESNFDQAKINAAKKCVHNALNALSEGNHEAAQRFLVTAEKLHPTNEAKQLLATMFAREGSSNDEDYNETLKNKYRPLLQQAENYIRDGNHNMAKELLFKVQPFFPERVKDLFDQIRGSTNAQHNHSNFKNYDIDEAEKCLKKAHEAFVGKDLDKAERLTLKAERLCSTKRGKQLLQQIFAAKAQGPSYWGSNQANTNSNDKNTFKSRNAQQYGANDFNNHDKESADKCVKFAIEAFKKGDLDRAEHFLLKAERLCPSGEAKSLLKKVLTAKTNRHRSDSRTDTNNKNNSSNNNRNNHERNGESSSKNKPTGRSAQKKPTEDQLAEIRRVFAAKEDSYKILDVTRQANAADIAKAYKRLVLLLHPDKNSAPEAGEAFRMATSAKDRAMSAL